MFDAFKDIPLSELPDQITEAKFSVEPNEGINIDDYDFDVSINDPNKGYLGFEGNNLRAVGVITISDSECYF